MSRESPFEKADRYRAQRNDLISHVVFATADLNWATDGTTASAKRLLDEKLRRDREQAEDFRDLVRMMLLDCVPGGDEADHALEVSEDGDGWNEPYSEHYQCTCDEWSGGWVQKDPECSGRPDPVAMAMAWRQHVLDTYPKDEAEADFSASRFIALMSETGES